MDRADLHVFWLCGHDREDGASRESAVVGETPNLADRLQGLARPNTAVLASRTHTLAKGQFDYADLGPHQLKGIADPVQVREVVAEAHVDSWLEARRGSSRLTPLIGRTEEDEPLHQRWVQAQVGDEGSCC